MSIYKTPKEHVERYLNEIEEKLGIKERQKEEKLIEYWHQQGLGYQGEIPELHPDDVPKKYFNGVLIIPNIFNLHDKIATFYPYATNFEQGEIVDITWRLNAINMGLSVFVPHYKIQCNDGQIIWRYAENIMFR